MLAQFKTSDGAVWLADTLELKWARVSAPVNARWTGMKEDSAPSEQLESEVLEHGSLAPQGYGVYAMEGRTPRSPDPGKGLCSLGIMPVALGTTLEIWLRANVPVRDFTMPRPIETVLYKVLPAQGGTDGGQGQEQEEAAPGTQEPPERGLVPGEETGAEHTAPEAGVGPGDEELDQQVRLQGAVEGALPPED